MNTDDKVEGCEELTLIVYRTYRRLLEEDGTPLHAPSDDADAADAESDDDAELCEEEQRQRKHDRERRAYIKDLGVCPEMMPVSWHSMFLWVERKSDLADDCKVKSACGALGRALRSWRHLEASVAQSYLGVSLNMLFQWIWPCSAYANVARMLRWIGQHEFEKLRQATPRVITNTDTIQLEGIFKALDKGRKGYLEAEDLAGGAVTDAKAKLRNIVDVDTVRAVYGRGVIKKEQFLEIMCEDNFRGHDGAMQAQLADGRRLIHARRQVLGCHGWLFEDTPKSEESQRALVEAIELEVCRWENLGKAQRKAIFNDKKKSGKQLLT